MSPHTTWLTPDPLSERKEFVRTALSLGLDLEELLRRASEAGLEPLTDEVWSQLENTDSNADLTVERAEHLARTYGRDIGRIFAGLAAGASLPAPLVLLREGERPYLVGGNTRLMASRALGHTPKVLLVRM